MNRALVLVLAALAAFLPGAALAQSGARVVATYSWVEEWDPASQRWVRVGDSPESIAPAAYHTTRSTVARGGGVTVTETVIEPQARFIAAPSAPARAAGSLAFGPFRVIDGRRAALVGSTDAASPHAFAAMLAKFPGLEVIEFVDAPGTRHDLANLRLGRAIRAAGLATHVPAGGSARSGAVELFLAGARRTLDPGALFAVHSWRDEAGREPADFAPDAPENRLYLDYYAEMGMSPDQARAFYAMTNSVPHTGALWLEGAEMARWIAPATRDPATRPVDPLPASRLRAALAEAFPLRRATGSGRASAAIKAFTTSLILSLSKDADPTSPPRFAYAAPSDALLDSQAAFP